MITWVSVKQNQRLLVERGINQYKVMGPGWVLLMPGQHPLTMLDVGPKSQAFVFDEVQTVEKVPVEVTVQVLYQIEPTLFTDDLLPNVPALNESGWQKVLKWQSEHVLRQLLANHSWQDLGQQRVQQHLEQQLTLILDKRLKGIALNISNVSLIKTALPVNLQKTLVQAEQNGIEARGRAVVLKEYFRIFGKNLPKVMPYVVQWELLNVLHKNGGPQLILTGANLSLQTPISEAKPSQSILHQMGMPVLQERRKVEIKN